MTVSAFEEAETLVDEFGPRPAGSDAERRAARHLCLRLQALGRDAEIEPFDVFPAWPLGYAINAIVAIVGSLVAVSSATLGTVLVLAAAILTFLDLSGITPTTRRLLGRRASQNVVSWDHGELPGALILVAHYDTGPVRTRPLRPLFLAMLVLLACCVLRAGGLSGTFLTLIQFLPTVALIVYVALLLDIALSPATPGENDNASGAALVVRLAERLEDEELEFFRVHVVFTGSQKAMAQGMRSFLKRYRKELAPGETVVLNLDAVGSGELQVTKKEGPLLSVKSHSQIIGAADAPTRANREPSDGYAAASAGLPAATLTSDGERLEEDALADAEEFCVKLIRTIDEELSERGR